MEYCLDCGLKLKGRIDKKFCNDQCRSHYNNALNRDFNIAVNEINSILKRNSGILKNLSEKGVTRLSRNMLAAAGFNFNFFTHQVYEEKKMVNCCYNYGYKVLNKDELVLITLSRIDEG